MLAPPRWTLRPEPPGIGEALAGALQLPLLAGRLLAVRGCLSPDQASAFLSAGPQSLHPPSGLSGMAAAVERCARTLRERERVVVWGDYDVDGVTSTVLLLKLFTLLGGQASHYIPDRLKEGYGLNAQGLERLRREGASLVISVDCGVTALAEARAARALGLDLVITDHHLPLSEIPECAALVNPKASPDYPYSMLAGVGVAWKLSQALLAELKEPRAEEFLDAMLELVALGTVCDVAPLDGENRVLVRQGLARLRQGRWLGLRALCQEAGLDSAVLNAHHLGFALGPRLNAGGRVHQADLGVKLLLSKDRAECAQLASRLGEENRWRQAIEKKVVEEAAHQAEARVQAGDLGLVLWGEGWHPGVVGLAASRIVERYQRPAVVLSLENGSAKGSARSRRPLHLVRALEACAPLLERFGGHEAAAGLALPAANLEKFRERFNALAAEALGPGEPAGELEIDLACRLEEMTPGLMRSLEVFEPFGHGNPRPLFTASGCFLMPGTRAVGAGGEHLKLRLGQGDAVFDGIAFRKAHLLAGLVPGRAVEAAFSPQWNDFQGSRRLEIDVKDLRPGA